MSIMILSCPLGFLGRAVFYISTVKNPSQQLNSSAQSFYSTSYPTSPVSTHFNLNSNCTKSSPSSFKMQLTKMFTVLSLAAASLAAPSVELYEKRTDSVSCAQGQGKLACCEQKPELKPVSSLGSTLTPTLGGILGIPVSLLALLVPTVSVAAQCKISFSLQTLSRLIDRFAKFVLRYRRCCRCPGPSLQLSQSLLLGSLKRTK